MKFSFNVNVPGSEEPVHITGTLRFDYKNGFDTDLFRERKDRPLINGARMTFEVTYPEALQHLPEDKLQDIKRNDLFPVVNRVMHVIEEYGMPKGVPDTQQEQGKQHYDYPFSFGNGPYSGPLKIVPASGMVQNFRRAIEGLGGTVSNERGIDRPSSWDLEIKNRESWTEEMAERKAAAAAAEKGRV